MLTRARSLSVRWDGSLQDLPARVDGAIVRGFDEDGANVLCAMLVTVPRKLQGRGLSTVAVQGMRELDGAEETVGQPWASDMITLLSETWQLVLAAEADGRSALSDDELERIRTAYWAIIAAGFATNLPAPPTGQRGRPKRSKAANLLSRLDAYEDDVLRFARDFRVGFDNNLAERDIRIMKVQQKVSGGFRSFESAEAWLAIRSYLSTAAKNGLNLFDALQRLCVGDPWMPATLVAGP